MREPKAGIISVEFVPSGRGKAQCTSDPRWPNGIDIDAAKDGPGCKVKLPHPAPECGYFLIICSECHATVAITAAGRLDDPRSIVIPCLLPAYGSRN
jgi:hypothetical protein